MIGAGTAPLGGALVSDEAAVGTIRRWLELGVNYIDSSPNYGDGEAERKLGLALANVPRSSYVLQISICVDDHNLLRRYMDQGGLRSALQEAGVGVVTAGVLYRGLLT